MTDKRCTKCGESKPLDQFSNDRSKRDGLNGRCAPCDSDYRRQWRSANPFKRRRQNVRYGLGLAMRKALEKAGAE